MIVDQVPEIIEFCLIGCNIGNYILPISGYFYSNF
jgi:hypothetical protein